MDFSPIKTSLQVVLIRPNSDTAKHSYGIHTSFTTSSNPLGIITSNSKIHLTNSK
jgi:hypothetical protein